MKPVQWRMCVLAALLTFVAQPSQAPAATLKVIYSFCAKASCADGSVPMGELFVGSTGALYGTALAGGAHDGGVVYRLRRDTGTGKWKYEALYDFCARTGCADGRAPGGRLIADVSGNLYGVAFSGALFGGDGGTAFKLTRRSRGTGRSKLFTGSAPGRNASMD